jgi:ubiquinone/menaquinone biosynthesis C-methylase UbiE
LEELSRPLDIIDIPVGIGRFFPSFSRGQDNVVGIDISSDMLDAARQHPNAGACNLSLAMGDIFNLDCGAKSFDCAICIRFLNLVDSNRMMRALSALESMSRFYVIAGVRFIP